MGRSFGNGDLRETPDKKFQNLKSSGGEGRDTAGGTYDEDPAIADEKSLPEGMTRPRKGPLGPSQGRRQ